MKQQIMNRLPGGDLWVGWMARKKLKGTPFEFFSEYSRKAYFAGGSSVHFMDEVADEIKQMYADKDGICDFGSMKLATADIQETPCEFMELILPYLMPVRLEIGEGTYESDTVRVEKDDIVIDAGANLGFFTAFAAAFRGAQVYALSQSRRLQRDSSRL